MAKRRIIFILVLIAIVLIFSVVALPAMLGGEEYIMEEMERIGDKDIPAAVYLWLEENKDVEGYGAFYSQGHIYLAARMGRRPTGGYSVLLGDVQGDESVTVKVQHNSPKPWDIVTQVITYPRTVAKVQCYDEPPTTAIFLGIGDTVLANVAVVHVDADVGA